MPGDGRTLNLPPGEGRQPMVSYECRPSLAISSASFVASLSQPINNTRCRRLPERYFQLDTRNSIIRQTTRLHSTLPKLDTMNAREIGGTNLRIRLTDRNANSQNSVPFMITLAVRK